MSKEGRITKQRQRREYRVRGVQKGSSRLRATVFRSNKAFYVQIIDDIRGVTVVSASTSDLRNSEISQRYGNCEAAAAIGRLIAARATAIGITEVRLDRGRHRYHGRVRAFADAARGGGLMF